MSEETNFEFDKFIVDIEKRNNKNLKEKQVAQAIIEEDVRRRQRARNYQELWQNQITWSKGN